MPESVRKFQYQGRDALQLPAEREAFATLKAWLSDIAGELELPEKTRKQLLIAADEIFTNIATYGYPRQGGSAEVKVAFDVVPQVLAIEFIDTGVAYNPLENAAPDVSKPLAERNVGGLGIFMVKKMMDSVEYRRADGCNHLILKKCLNRGPRT